MGTPWKGRKVEMGALGPAARSRTQQGEQEAQDQEERLFLFRDVLCKPPPSLQNLWQNICCLM